MKIKNSTIFSMILIVIIVGVFLYQRSKSFSIPKGETIPLIEIETLDNNEEKNMTNNNIETSKLSKSKREVFVTDGVKHSISLNEILPGGPPKDGIQSIDNPKFINAKDADFLEDESIGLGFTREGISRFYPFSILVWHEIVNDTIGDNPVLITYCPLCATAVVFEREIDGKEVEFGVSGRLWQSNLLMYNRGSDEEESLWSQVLGEAVLGEFTGKKLKILSADTVRFSEWKNKHPDTEVLSIDTGLTRNYDRDPYGDYYTSDRTIFPVTNRDDRLNLKDLVIGIEIEGKTKAYLESAISVGETTDNFANEKIIITKNNAGEVRFFVGEARIPTPGLWGFWFSWVAVHPDTELYK